MLDVYAEYSGYLEATWPIRAAAGDSMRPLLSLALQHISGTVLVAMPSDFLHPPKVLMISGQTVRVCSDHAFAVTTSSCAEKSPRHRSFEAKVKLGKAASMISALCRPHVLRV